MRNIVLSIVLMFVFSGCTLPSTKLAQNGSMRVQAVQDGVENDLVVALGRENFEVAKLSIVLELEKAKSGQTPEVQAKLDAVAVASTATLKEFAKKRDATMGWDRDHERANALKYVTVDQKLFSSQGILNYLGNRLVTGSKKVITAWDAAKQEWKDTLEPEEPETPKPVTP